MKAVRILSIAALVAGCSSTAYSQVYSQNIVGYANLSFYAGDNYLANPFLNGDNSLDTLFPSGSVPDGATFTEWNPATQQFLPASTYDTASGWSIDYTLGLGQGGLLDTPSAFVNTFVGEVWPGFSPLSSTFTPPPFNGAGPQFLSCCLPIDATFYDVVGRDPVNGESVTTLDAATQAYTTTTFDNGVWDNGAPDLAVGEAAFFNLDAVGHVLSIPEPSANRLAFAGALTLIGLTGFRRLAQRPPTPPTANTPGHRVAAG